MDFAETDIVNSTLWLLGVFSVLTWCIILLKLGDWCINWSRNHAFTQQENKGGSGLFDMAKSQKARIHHCAKKVIDNMSMQAAMNPDQRKEWHELVEKSLQQQLRKEKSAMDSGLGWLASFGSTSPFVGLFGTVWGIMHALEDISAKGSASLEVVAGPIGEALIATAIGIAVAVPAVLAYNLFVRLNKGTMAKLEHYAGDKLHNIIQQHLQQHTVTADGIENAR